MSLILRLLILSSFLYLEGLYSQDTWKVFKAVDGDFSVLVPADMNSHTDTIQTSVGAVLNKTYFVNQVEGDPNFLYAIQCNYYPIGSFPADSTELIDEFLKESLISISEVTKTGIVYKSERSFQSKYKSYIARLANNETGMSVKTFLVIVDDAFYSLQVYTANDKSLNDNIDKFLDSFKILAPK
jgi:hypothetical protein